jgi:hypothetical protein
MSILPLLTPLPVDGISVNETLIELSEKAYMVPFSSPLLGVHYQVQELLPVVDDQQRVIPDLVDDLLLDSLQSIITKSFITKFW